MILVLSGYLPTPTSLPVIFPKSGSIIKKPLDLNNFTFDCVASFNHISGCIAGTRIFGFVEAKTILVNKSSALPCANLAIKSAVAGAITIKSDLFDNIMCGTSSVSLHKSE